MSVHYILNKKVRVKDLKDKGFTVEQYKDKNTIYSLLIHSDKYNDSIVSAFYVNETTPNINDWEIRHLEGRFSLGGGCTMLDMVDKLGIKFITDEDEDEAIHNNSEITEDTFNNRVEWFYKQFTKD